MPDRSLLARIEEFAQANGLTWRRNKNKIGIAFRDGLDEQRLDLSSLSLESLEGLLESFAKLDKSRHSILEAISKVVRSRGGSVERKPSGWMIKTGEGMEIQPDLDWRWTRKLTSEDPAKLLCDFLRTHHIDPKALVSRTRGLLAGEEPSPQKPVSASASRLITEDLAPGVLDGMNQIRAKLDSALNEGDLSPDEHAKMVSEMEAASNRLDEVDNELEGLIAQSYGASKDPFEISRLLLDFEPRHEIQLEILPLESGFDLGYCDAWARTTIEEMRKSPVPDWYRKPCLWIPEIDIWMTDGHWEAWAEGWLRSHPSSWSAVAASILLRPGGKTEHRQSARCWAEHWKESYGHDSDCYEEILLPFIQEIEGLEECLDVTTWHVMVRAWNAGDSRWEKNLRDAVFAHDSMCLDHLIHPGMRRSFWEDLFSPDDLDKIRQHLLDWSLREPAWELRYGFASYVHLAVVMDWKDVLESVANRPFLSHHLGSLDIPVVTLKENSRRLLETFRAHLDSLPGRDREADRIAIDRLASRLDKSVAHTEIPDALICTAAEEFRPYTLPLFARAIHRFGDRHAPETAFTDSWALAVGWSRLRPRETLGEAQ